MIPVPVYDILEVLETDSGRFEFHTSGLPVPGTESTNLCVRAFHLMKANYGIPNVRIHLHKQIPLGSGMGGGSSDGAFTLLLLNSIFGCALSDEDLEALALELGSDCPFFIRNRPVVATGRGEIMEPVANPASGSYLIIARPQFSISTSEAFGRITPAIPEKSIREIVQLSPKLWRQYLRNDFEPVVMELYPEAARISDAFYEAGAYYARMTGSGSAFFGLFREEPFTLPAILTGITLFSGRVP